VSEFLSQLFHSADPAHITAEVSLVVAAIALLGTVLSALVLFLNARSSLYVSAVTVERSKWINALRENIASVSGKLRTLSYRVDGQGQESLYVAVSEINDLMSLIRLQLNPSGEIEKHITEILEKMPALAEKPNGEELRKEDASLLAHCQWLLKAEWERVKYEARGPFGRLWQRMSFKQRRYMRRYRNFCKTETRAQE
jgi:hypothetical protein